LPWSIGWWHSPSLCKFLRQIWFKREQEQV